MVINLERRMSVKQEKLFTKNTTVHIANTQALSGDNCQVDTQIKSKENFPFAWIFTIFICNFQFQ